MKISMMKSDQLQQAVELSDRIFLSSRSSLQWGILPSDILAGYQPFLRCLGSGQTGVFHGIRAVYHPDSRCPIKYFLHRLRLHGPGLPGTAACRQSPGTVHPAWRVLRSFPHPYFRRQILYTRAGSRLFGRALRFRLSPAVVEPLRAATGKK